MLGNTVPGLLDNYPKVGDLFRGELRQQHKPVRKSNPDQPISATHFSAQPTNMMLIINTHNIT